MSHRPFNPAIPGPAGLYFCRESLTPAGLAQDLAAQARLESWCAYCGQSASHGYGVSLTCEGIQTCADPDCMAQGRAAAAGRARVTAEVVAPVVAAPAPAAEPVGDLFGRAA